MVRLLIVLVSCLSTVFANYSIVFVHVGKEIPSYADVAISQARLFNPKARIILLSSQEGLARFFNNKDQDRIELCDYNTLPKSKAHQKYEKLCVETSPFWRYTSERFLYLCDLMNAYSLDNVFHLENDNMLYADLEPLLSHFQEKYPGIGATFDNEDRCIPGFVWISNCRAMEDLAKYFAEKAPEKISDMVVIGKYRNARSKEQVDSLPIVMPEYAASHTLISPHRHKTKRPEVYSNHSEVFHAIFDAAAIGQFLGGIDPIHANNQPGFINESCLFNPSLLQYEWVLDEQGRSVPYANFKERSYKIINLHIHSKRLHNFKS